MFGCLRNIGCLVVILAAAVLAYLNWDQVERWLDRRAGGDTSAASPAGGGAGSPAPAAAWEPITPEGAKRAQAAIESLGRRSGPVFADVRGSDLASYILSQLTQQGLRSADSVQAAVRGDRLYVRTSVRLGDLGGQSVLGPLAGLLGERESMEFGGSFHVVRPGLAEFRVAEIRLRDFNVPGPVVPRIVGQLRRNPVPEGVGASGLPLDVPPYIGDVRIARGRVVLYKNVR